MRALRPRNHGRMAAQGLELCFLEGLCLATAAERERHLTLNSPGPQPEEIIGSARACCHRGLGSDKVQEGLVEGKASCSPGRRPSQVFKYSMIPRIAPIVSAQV